MALSHFTTLYWVRWVTYTLLSSDTSVVTIQLKDMTKSTVTNHMNAYANRISEIKCV